MSARITIWGTPSVGDLIARPTGHLPFPLEHPACRLYSRARHALWSGVRQLGLADGDEVLTPAYHHGSEVEALLRAGLQCRFYEIDTMLQPEVSALDRLVGPRTRALLLIHYLGRPQQLTRWRKWCDERGLLLLEDAAQSWLATSEGRPVGAVGDLAIFCLYKTVSIPDGAALVCEPPPPPPGRRELGLASWARERTTGVVARFPSVKRLARRLLRRAPAEAHTDFDLGEPDTAPTWVSTRMLPRLVGSHTASSRRANYASLAAELERFVRPPFDHLPAGASPMLLPLTFDRDQKPAVLERLARHGIEGVDFWALPHPALPVDEFPRSAALRDSVVGVPVHQGIDANGLERIAQAVQAS